MNEGQQHDYDVLRILGVDWTRAMDYCLDHPLGNSNNQELSTHALKAKYL